MILKFGGESTAEERRRFSIKTTSFFHFPEKSKPTHYKKAKGLEFTVKTYDRSRIFTVRYQAKKTFV